MKKSLNLFGKENSLSSVEKYINDVKKEHNSKTMFQLAYKMFNTKK